jgi:hypothetical protein
VPHVHVLVDYGLIDVIIAQGVTVLPKRRPWVTNVRMDPLERAEDEAAGWVPWQTERLFAFVPASAFVAQ